MFQGHHEFIFKFKVTAEVEVIYTFNVLENIHSHIIKSLYFQFCDLFVNKVMKL